MTITLRAASEVNLETLTQAFNTSYEGYIMPVNLSPAQMNGHVENNDVDLNASLLAYDGDHMVGIGLLGIREHRGWIGGIGVIASHRRHGIGRQLMQGMVDNAYQRGIDLIQLEVIESNDRAIALYEAFGYETVARLMIVDREAQETQANTDGLSISQVTAGDVLTAPYFHVLHPHPLNWQREIPSLQAQLSRLSAWTVSTGGETLAFGIAQASDAMIRWEAIGFAPGREDVLRALLVQVHQAYPTAKGRFVNVYEHDPVLPTMRDLGYVQIMSQREMWLRK